MYLPGSPGMDISLRTGRRSKQHFPHGKASSSTYLHVQPGHFPAGPKKVFSRDENPNSVLRCSDKTCLLVSDTGSCRSSDWSQSCLLPASEPKVLRLQARSTIPIQSHTTPPRMNGSHKGFPLRNTDPLMTPLAMRRK